MMEYHGCSFKTDNTSHTLDVFANTDTVHVMIVMLLLPYASICPCYPDGKNR